MAVMQTQKPLPQNGDIPRPWEPKPLTVKGEPFVFDRKRGFQAERALEWCRQHFPAWRELDAKRDEIAARPPVTQ